ncbi:MAG: glycosyltransferase family 4 protein [Bryobacteraceae bacterium]
MRVLLAASASYVPPRGGATRSNLAWLRTLAAAGHACRIVCGELAAEDERARQMREERIGAAPFPVFAATDPAARVRLLREQVREFHPDWVLVSSEDLSHALLREASEAAPGRVVYLAHTPQFYPFGPESWNADSRAAAVLERAAAVVVISASMAEYTRAYLGRAAEIVHPPVYGAPPYPALGGEMVVMINPCALKGIGVFLALAQRFPNLPFGALPGWGTTAADRAALSRLPNVTLLPNVKAIEELLARTRVLLMPSLWLEGFGLIVVEAMLHGVPVIASDSGGLREAKMGTRHLIPTPRVTRYEPVYDERHLPRLIAPPLEIEPWAEALGQLTGDSERYEEESRASREAALRFVSGVRPEALEELLLRLTPARSEAPACAVEALSPARKELLLRLMKKRRA